MAAQALQRLRERTKPAGTDWALGVEARAGALLSRGQSAEDLYQEAIERLGRCRMKMHLARAHLLYGEWLRREHRRIDARDQLGTAHEMLDAMGAATFLNRARTELLAAAEQHQSSRRRAWPNSHDRRQESRSSPAKG